MIAVDKWIFQILITLMLFSEKKIITDAFDLFTYVHTLYSKKHEQFKIYRDFESFEELHLKTFRFDDTPPILITIPIYSVPPRESNQRLRRFSSKSPTPHFD